MAFQAFITELEILPAGSDWTDARVVGEGGGRVAGWWAGPQRKYGYALTMRL